MLFRSARWELDDHLQVPQNDVAPSRVVVVAECGNYAPTKWNVEVVEMLARDRLGAEIDGDRSEYVVGEVMSDFRVLGADRGGEEVVKLVEAGGEKLKGGWYEKQCAVVHGSRVNDRGARVGGRY